jgi:hypothetical protein
MRMITRRLFWTGLVACSVMVLPSCGGGGGTSTPTAPATPAGPTQARITVTAAAPVISNSPRNGFAFRIAITSTITEAAGLGGNINFVRMRFIANGVEIERSEISSADLILQTGTNRLAASSSRTLPLVFDTNAAQATSAQLLYNFTDDRGNNLEAPFTVTF